MHSETLVRDELAARALVQVTMQDVPPIERQSALVRRSKRPLSPEACAFVDSLRRHAGALGLLPRAKTRRARVGG